MLNSVSLSVIVCLQEVNDDINTSQFLTTLPWQQEERVSLSLSVFLCALCLSASIDWQLVSFSCVRFCLPITTKGQCAGVIQTLYPGDHGKP